MTRTTVIVAVAAAVVCSATAVRAQETAGITYVGGKTCAGVCHKTDKKGSQLGVVQNARHARAYTTLTTDQADAIARSKGLAKPAAESPECPQCPQGRTVRTEANVDITADAAIEKQCRSCHNEKSPTFKEFNFAERWAKIRHQLPKDS